VGLALVAAAVLASLLGVNGSLGITGSLRSRDVRWNPAPSSPEASVKSRCGSRSEPRLLLQVGGARSARFGAFAITAAKTYARRLGP
jgi:hypothetical protein